MQFWKNILWTDETKINLYQYDGKRKIWRRHCTAHDPKHTTSSVKHGRGSVMAWSWMAASGTRSAVMMWRRQDRSTRMNSEMFRILSAQIQPNWLCSAFIIQIDNDPKHKVKPTKDFYYSKEVEYSWMAKSVTSSQPNWACISLVEVKNFRQKSPIINSNRNLLQ